MGIFSSIWKGIKGIVKGIGKVFKAILKPVAKLLGSDFGKILMLGLAVFTLGASLIAGFQGFMQGSGFIGRFINGGKAFLNTLLGTNFEVTGGGNVLPGGIESGLPKAGGQGPILGEEMAGEMLIGEGGVGGLSTPTIPTPAPGLAPVPSNIPGGGIGGGGGNWLSNAATAVKDFAMTPGGGTIIGGVISGVGAGMRQKNEQEFDSRVERMFANPNDPGMLALAAHDYNINAPRSLAPKTGKTFSNTLAQIRSARNIGPSVPWQQPAGAQ